MQGTLEIVLPVFAVIACGYLFARLKLISDSGVGGIVNFVFYIAIPALLFRTMAGGAVQQQFDISILGAYFSGMLLLFGLSWLVSRHLFGNKGDFSAVGAMSASFSNLVLIGFPLVQRAYGDAGLLPLTLIVTIHSAVQFTTTTLAIQISRGSGRNWGHTLATTLRSVLSNPVVLGALSGLAYGFTGLGLPVMLDETLSLLERGAGPLSLFAVGATLASFKLAGDLRESLTMTALKLVVMPALVWVTSIHVFALPPGWVTVAVLGAALPTGANVYILARKYDIYTARATAVVMLSTLGSIVTLTLLIAILPPP
ncbi:AEC family transporter [Telmatospirillum sp. J64-1]|uniref:AEC family transporter n=1 Tax=Telmatospirillum sp. J64-1 TaxID=2502183 RepID=UPI00163D861F|nr:AEC family transporter [Telmatospirillum sp. J64-1]